MPVKKEYRNAGVCQILQNRQGRAVRPYRSDGYANVLNKYGTPQDNSEAYRYEREPVVPDMQLTSLYESNGLFAKIIDTPAEEAVKHGFSLGLNNAELDTFVETVLDDLEWEEKASTAIKWARLYGGALMVMLVDDGRGLEEPLDWKHIRSIDELRVFERAVVQPDYTSLYTQDYGGTGGISRTSKFGKPEFYYVSSIYGSFAVHESRCLVFRNGVLPEKVSNSVYQMWGMPEYVRIKRSLRETVTAHTDATKLLERSVQAIYAMKNLASLLATDDGENQVVRRLEVIDMARGLLNSIAIDADGESYDFKSISFSGVKDVIDSTCNMLSALTNIPQTLLFGRSPACENATGVGDLENYYNFVERIQRLMLKRNLRALLDIVFRAGAASGEIGEAPGYKLTFNPLWSLSDMEQAQVEQARASASLTKAQTAQAYVDMGALDPSEVRRKLASDDEFTVEEIIDGEDGDLLESFGAESSSPTGMEIQENPENSLLDSEHSAIINMDFEESDHPRDEDGKFADTGGTSAEPAERAAPAVLKKPPKPTRFTRNEDTMEITKNTRIKIGSTQNRTIMVKGTLTGIEDFAGVEGKKPVEKEPELLAQYPNSKKGSWRHTLGYGQVQRKDGKLQEAEIHWFESDDVGQVGWKVKRFGKGKHQ